MRVYDFYAEWCGPCKVLSKVLDEVLEEYKDVELIKVNIEEEVDLTEEKQIRGVPTLIFEKDGIEVDRTVGAINKQKLIELLNK